MKSVARFPWELVAPGIVLFILPIAHTTPLRFVCIGLAALGIFGSLAHHRGARDLPVAVVAALCFWFSVCLVASWTSIEPAYSWGEFRNEVVTPSIAFGVFFWLTDSVDAWRRFRIVLLASLFTVSIIAIASYQRDADWLRSSLVGDRNAYSTYVVLAVPFLLACWQSPDFASRRGRLVLAAASVLAVVSGASTQNRNMWFAVALECVVFGAIVALRSHPDVRGRLVRRMLVGGALGVVVLAGVLVVVIQQKAVVSNTSTEEQARFDRDPRFEIWRYAGERIAERPWTGYGYGRGILRRDFRARFDNPLKWHGHNMAIDYVMEAGVAGGLAIVALFAALARQAWRIGRAGDAGVWPLGAWTLALLAGVTLKVMTDDILVRESAIYFWSCLGMAFGLAARAAGRVAPAVTPG